LRIGFAICALMWLGMSTGCSRVFWRTQADMDVYDAVSERMNDNRWIVPRVDVTPDTRSRFYTPYDLDYQPLPPDDPAASVYLHRVDGWEGYKGWHDFGTSFTVENPQWMSQFGLPPVLIDPVTEKYVATPPPLEELTLQESIELSLIHSREYQFEIEDLYLAALGLTLDRYQFAVRYLGVTGAEPGISEDVTILPRRPGDNLTQRTNFGVSQVLPTGAQWAVELTNNTLWLFSGPGQTNSASVLSFSLVQPLIMGAGRKVVLEALTQGERELLYATRDLARFRQVFFCDVVGSSGGGFFGLLQQLQFIRNQRDNLSRLEQQLFEQREASAQQSDRHSEQLEALPPELLPAPGAEPVYPEIFGNQLSYNPQLQTLIWIGEMTEEQEQALLNLSADPAFLQSVRSIVTRLRTTATDLTVLQLESQYAAQINDLRNQERGYQDSLDRYKIQLGLPTDMPIGIDSSLLDPFVFIDPQIRDLEPQIRAFIPLWAQLDEENPSVESLLAITQQLQDLVMLTDQQGFMIVEEDFRRMEAALPRRLAALDDEQDRLRVERDLAGDERVYGIIAQEYETLRNQVSLLVEILSTGAVPVEEQIALMEAIFVGKQFEPGDALPYRDAIARLQENLLRVARNLQVVQIGLRVELITLADFDLTMEEVQQIALENRVDLMNAQARVVDAYRLVEIAANQLQTPVDIVVDGDVGTSGGNRPFDFRADQTTLRAGVRVTAPIDQLAERNNYRAAQIAYDRQRRDYMAFEDNVKLQVRQAWRQLEVLRQNVETSRQAIRIAALQLDLAIEEVNAPQVGAAQGAVSESGAQGVNLLRALDSVLNAQNGLIVDWLDYERARLNIYRDMGIMEVGPDGLWNDPIYRSESNDIGTVEIRGQSPLETGFAGHSSLGDWGGGPVCEPVLETQPVGSVGRATLRPSRN
jgi:hypothetical protein